MRQCDRCHSHMPAYVPRTRVGDDFLCDACVANPRGGYVSASLKKVTQGGDMSNEPMSFEDHIKKQAHDSGDGETIYHCPFCGSGQVIARSDRTIECEFCHTCFTVQVQPQFSAFPQTINGMPVDVPGMPGQSGVDPMTGLPPMGDPMGGGETNPDGSPMMDPMGGGAVPPGAEGEDPEAEGEDPESEDGGNPFAKKDKKKDGGNPFTSSLHVKSGRQVAVEDYLAHLAIMHTPNRERTLAMIRSRRARRG